MDFDVIVHCGGKCGSSTLSETFSNMGLKTLHVHSDEHLKTIKDNGSLETNIDSVRQLVLSQTKQNVIVIDAYRTPLERLISSYFQHMEKIPNYDKCDYLIHNYEILKQKAAEDYHPYEDTFSYLFEDKGFKEKYIVNVHNNIAFIKLRFADIEHWGTYLSEILGYNVEIVSSNLSNTKEYFDFYEKFKNNVKIPKSLFDHMINCPIFKKYNTKEEQLAYIKKWSSHIVNDNVFDELMLNFIFNLVPEDFNSKEYKNINKDLKDYLTGIDLKIHYELYGFYEQRQYKTKIIPIKFLTNFKVLYGHDTVMKDITRELLLLTKDNKIIVEGKYNDLFGDPVSGTMKVLLMVNGDQIITFIEDEKFTLKIKTE